MLLRQIRLPFRSLPGNVSEEIRGDHPENGACILAEEKALSVFDPSAGSWLLGADTMVLLGRDILGKPESRDKAAAMLRRLSGKEHRVITGFCLLDPQGRRAHREAVITKVTFKSLSEEEIERYVASGEPLDKAGGYAIQGLGAFLVEGLSGSYTNVVGLPLCALVRALLATGALEAFPLSDTERSLRG